MIRIVMRNLFISFLCLGVIDGAIADVLSAAGGDLQGGKLYTNSTIIDTGTDFNVKQPASVQIQNSGTITNRFNVESGAQLTQVIKSDADATLLNVNNSGVFNLFVDGDADTVISLAKVAGISENAGVINVDNGSHLLIDGSFDSNMLMGKTIKIESNESVWLHVADDFDAFDLPVMYQYSFDTDAIKFATTSPLYNFTLAKHGGELFISKNRATNYTDILKNDMGRFLDTLNPDDALRRRLDSAPGMGEINDIIENSVRLNPIKLMDSVHAMNMFAMNDIYDLDDGFRIAIKPEFVFGGGLQSVGGRVAASSDVTDRLYIGASVYGYMMSYDKDINKYDATVFGGDLRLDYRMNNIFVRGMAGANMDKFDIGSVFDGSMAIDNPSGHSFYAYADGGYKFILSDEINICAFGGVGMDNLTVLDDDKSQVFGRGGADVSYNIKTGDVSYMYNGRVSVNTFGYLDAAFGAGAWLHSDDVGGGISVGVSDSDVGWMGRVTANVKLLF